LNAPPVRLVLLTHYHSDHVGGNPYWRAKGARIVGHANLAAQMRKDSLIAGWENWHRTPEPAEALPDETFTDALALHAGAEEIRLTHIPSAHTDGDAIVWFPAANIIHTGDLLEREAPPFIDWWTGGRLEGMLAGVDWVLEHSDSATRIVPGHGTVARRGDVVAYRQMLLHAAREVAAGTREPGRFTRLLTVGLEQFEPAAFRVRLAPGTPEARLAWLLGCWQFTRGEFIVTERWRVRADGALEGQGRSTRSGRLVDSEETSITARDGRLVFTARPLDQQKASFTEAESGADAITFGNPAHDFPTRVSYRSAGAAGLHASVAGPGQGGERVIEFPYDAARCPDE
jgi:glyoxylase-like metal-dependent hydrolase (beta-lactamase superfamily II)